MKKFILVLTACLFVLGISLTAALATDPPTETMTVTNYGSKDAVKFAHKTHVDAKIECVTCHHKATAPDAAADQYKCGNCHKAEAEAGVPAIKDAAHEKDTGKCWKCHNSKSPDVKKELKCKDCHVGA
ncbi:MAG: hypothetical protein AUK47_04390 [Deltaproteobacteria bacterium CG2_30_63_29]|nr:MAG: hypothetical protein AUK47_04390 [Deltaproteobacteria bacterium CG2_30_63_29]PIW02200.1 MAG: hypothetical protein COW42_02605 [Deltaproteobacteria bacterium CG17_big_fil_post_rev_8_21_14_2_50_63_7]